MWKCEKFLNSLAYSWSFLIVSVLSPILSFIAKIYMFLRGSLASLVRAFKHVKNILSVHLGVLPPPPPPPPTTPKSWLRYSVESSRVIFKKYSSQVESFLYMLRVKSSRRKIYRLESPSQWLERVVVPKFKMSCRVDLALYKSYDLLVLFIISTCYVYACKHQFACMIIYFTIKLNFFFYC